MKMQPVFLELVQRNRHGQSDTSHLPVDGPQDIVANLLKATTVEPKKNSPMLRRVYFYAVRVMTPQQHGCIK
jgi:hypothetical protein